MARLIADKYKEWEAECNERFNRLKANEEELNRIFIDIYGLQDELSPEVEDKDVTVRKADLTREIKSLISYAVGCMFGRYSLDVEGLAYAGGEFSDQWVVISGQYYKREVVEYYVSEELSRVDSLAEIYEFSREDLSARKISSYRGNICAVRSDETGSCLYSFQYRRGTGKKLFEGIQELFVNGKRVECGTGNATYDLCSPEILRAITDRSGAELVSRGWEDAKRIDWQALAAVIVGSDQLPVGSDSTHYPLTTPHYSPDKDNIIPICDDEYFEDDIVGRFVKFIEVVYGKETLEENLRFIANALGGNGLPRDVIRNYFLSGFYADHLKVYQKRPIYWLFDSGKKNGFKALIYMHRYRPDTLARMRTDYVHEQQARYRTAIEDCEQRLLSASGSEMVKIKKRLESLTAQAEEIRQFEERVHHLADMMIAIDLDDGVKHNYEIFKDILAPIK